MGIGIDTIKKLRVVEFDWKDSGEHEIGLIAEEVNKIIPEATFKNINGQIEGLKITPLVAVLVKAVQELEEKVRNA